MTTATSSSVLRIPSPRSPPQYPDLCGKHRKQVELNILNREIGFLELLVLRCYQHSLAISPMNLRQEELRSLEALQPASRCCKEVDEFVGTNPDPLIPLKKSKFCMSWICCCPSLCAFHLGKPCCASGPSKNWWCCCQRCCQCPNCCHCFRSICCRSCFEKSSCSPCCALPSFSCPDCSCSCVCTGPKCTRVCHCRKYSRNCCLPCCYCS